VSGSQSTRAASPEILKSLTEFSFLS